MGHFNMIFLIYIILCRSYESTPMNILSRFKHHNIINSVDEDKCLEQSTLMFYRLPHEFTVRSVKSQNYVDANKVNLLQLAISKLK